MCTLPVPRRSQAHVAFTSCKLCSHCNALAVLITYIMHSMFSLLICVKPVVQESRIRYSFGLHPQLATFQWQLKIFFQPTFCLKKTFELCYVMYVADIWAHKLAYWTCLLAPRRHQLICVVRVCYLVCRSIASRRSPVARPAGEEVVTRTSSDVWCGRIVWRAWRQNSFHVFSLKSFMLLVGVH